VKKITIGFLLSLFLSLVTAVTNPVLAANPNFSTTLSIVYNVSQSGQTRVTHKIGLTNKSPALYAKQYGIKVSSPNITNVTVTSNGAALTPEVVNTDNQTSIGITFPDEVVGEGKTRLIEVSYLHPDAVVISGKVLEVLVPKLGTPDEYDSYDVSITTPSEFDLPTRVTPADFETQDNGGSITTYFSPQNGESVTALFGQQQIFDLKLRYHLENDSTNTGLAQIALPPDTAFQKINYQTLEPQPVSLEVDGDGNWIATYEVPPQTKTTVTALAKVLISLQPSSSFPSSSNIALYLRSQEFWETNSSEISQLASQLITPRAIHDHIVKTLSYNYAYLENKTPRLGALNTLAHPDQAACQEFTDSFIAIARAAQIPTRRLTGYAYTQNNQLRPTSLDQDILHAWPEYFDTQSQQWLPIDPTWENTTGGVNYFDQFDLNHIVFAINGLSSTTPYPAGSYKNSQKNTKDVEVTFASDFPETEAYFELKRQPIKVSLPGNNRLSVTNKTGLAWYNVQLSLDAGQLENIQTSALAPIPVILPYQTITLKVPLHSSQVSINLQTPVQLRLSYAVDNRNLTQQNTNQNHDRPETQTFQLQPISLSIGPSYLITLTHPYSLIAMGVGCTIITLGAGSLLVFRQRRQRPLRRKS